MAMWVVQPGSAPRQRLAALVHGLVTPHLAIGLTLCAAMLSACAPAVGRNPSLSRPAADATTQSLAAPTTDRAADDWWTAYVDPKLGARVDDSLGVQAAKAAIDVAKLNLSRAALRASFDGVVAQRQVQIDQRVSIGAELMTVVPISQVYVNANLKEVQLRKIGMGQSSELAADRYGKGVVFHGRVAGLSGGTGWAFALIPAQNATGNWIKVVQRLPVRIARDAYELEPHPLGVGLSMDARVDVSQPSAIAPAAAR